MKPVRSEMGPFVIVPRWVIESVSATALQLYVVLGTYCDRDLVARPSVKTLARDMDCSVRTVQGARNELQRAGALMVQARVSEQGDPTANEYWLRQVKPEGAFPAWSSPPVPIPEPRGVVQPVAPGVVQPVAPELYVKDELDKMYTSRSGLRPLRARADRVQIIEPSSIANPNVNDKILNLAEQMRIS